MDKNLTWKIVLIAVSVILAGFILYPPDKTLKPGIDLAGGTSLIYEIDTQDISPGDRRSLSEDVITILRRRIDPANIQNLIWRPQGNTRFEIQMPLASAEARDKRQKFEDAQQQLLDENINPALILRALKLPKEKRDQEFTKFAKGVETRLEILNTLAEVYDHRLELQTNRDSLNDQIKGLETKISDAGLNLDLVRTNAIRWAKLDPNSLNNTIANFDSLNLELLAEYTKNHAEWASVVDQLADPQEGINLQFEAAKQALNKLSLTEDQLTLSLDKAEDSAQRKSDIEKLKNDFSDRADLIDKVFAAYDLYRPFRGGLDDPKDLQRMLKGAGILEFRILPSFNDSEVSQEEMMAYVQNLKEKGPRFSSSNTYKWFEIDSDKTDDINSWIYSIKAVVGQFGDKFYVLASNKSEETMLHNDLERDWKLKDARPGTDQQSGQRAINFQLDDRGGILFSKLSGANINKPLCIILDDIAISAPTLRSRIGSEGQISGAFSEIERTNMVKKLKAGSLPAKLIEQPISIKTIGPSIGADNRDKGIKSGIIGLVVVVLCIAVYYAIAGSIADLALLLNILFVLAIMALVKATFTLPGIAGIILTIGMSVDANVLIFERIREEQARGASLRIAIRNGYQRAFRTILDANLTTFITAFILFWVASEEIKGFAIVLMLGIASSMFTALFVTRVIFDMLINAKILKEHLSMLQLIKSPKVDWMKLRPVFITISSIFIILGLIVFFTRDNTKNNKYDIEFTGGTSLVINLRDDVDLSRQQVEDKVKQVAQQMKIPALEAANVYSIGEPKKITENGERIFKQYEINTAETNKTTVVLTFEAKDLTGETVTKAIKTSQNKLDAAIGKLNVTQDSTNPAKFVVTTSQVNKSMVKNVLSKAFSDPNSTSYAKISEPVVQELVNDAVLTAFEGNLQIQENLNPQIESAEKITDQMVEAYPELAEFIGGLKITCKIQKQVSGEEILRRFEDLRFKPDMKDLTWYSDEILSSDLNPLDPKQTVDAFVYLSVEPEAGFRELSEEEWTIFTDNETKKVLAAAELETSLPRVTQIDPSVGNEAKNRAYVAIVLSLCAMIIYLWVRFGTARYGIAAIVALVHDVCIILGAVTACTYIAGTTFGSLILVGDFKINLAMIAAFLTLIGYSVNDTIVVFDRIRENKLKAQLNPQTINNSINQTLSRTMMTSFTTFIVVLIMYIFGGEGLRGFNFAIGLGIIVGTYSSIAIAAPILLLGVKTGKGEKK